MSAVAAARTLGLIACVGLVMLSPACGDDDESPADAGLKDDGGGAGRGGGGPPPRRDAGMMSMSDLVPPCDRADPMSCADGKICDLVFRRAAGDDGYTIYTGCVEKRPERGLGDPCDFDPTNGEKYSVPGLIDEVYTDSCSPDLICAPDPKVRGATTCQPMCQLNPALGSRINCASETALCLAANDYIQFCRESEGCDVTQQKGCRAGTTCYLLPAAGATKLLAACLPPSSTPIADGQMCDSFNGCNPGSICLGPVRLPPMRWDDPDIRCRKACGDSSDGDAGADEDAGVAQCGMGKSCVPFNQSGFDLKSVPNPPYGQCEP